MADFVTNSATARLYAILNSSGQLWDFTAGAWSTMPENGTPASNQFRVLDLATGTGSLSNLRKGSTPAGVVAAANPFVAFLRPYGNPPPYLIEGYPLDLVDCLALANSRVYTCVCGPPLAVAIVNTAGLVWNWATNAWNSMPGSGTPTPDQYRAMTRAASSGALHHMQYRAVPAALVGTVGTYAVYFTVQADGTQAGIDSDLAGVMV